MKHISTVARWSLAVGALATLHTTATDVMACTFAVQTAEAAYPGWGAEGVPTNVVLSASPRTLDPESFRLQTDDGAIVTIDVRESDDGWDITPTEPLAPNTYFQLMYGEESTTRFSTGEDPAEPIADLPAPTDVRLVAIAADVGTCGTLGALCAYVDLPAGASLEIRSGEEMLQPGGNQFTRPYSQLIDTSQCVSVRVRDALGNRSEAVEHCGVAAWMGMSELSCADVPNLPETNGPTPTQGDTMMPTVPDQPEPEPNPLPPTGVTPTQADPNAMVQMMASAGETASPSGSEPSGSDGLMGVDTRSRGCGIVQHRRAGPWGALVLLGVVVTAARRRRAPVGV